VPPELVVIVVVEALDRRVLDGSVHPLDLAVGPWMIDLGEAVLDAVFLASHGEHVGHVAGRWAVGVTRREAGLDAVVGQDRVDAVGHGGNKGFEEGRGCDAGGALDQLDKGELAGAVDGHEAVELAFGGLHRGDVDVEEADRVGLEGRLGGPVALDFGKSGDAMALRAAVQR
jgi:hypothetical protein